MVVRWPPASELWPYTGFPSNSSGRQGFTTALRSFKRLIVGTLF